MGDKQKWNIGIATAIVTGIFGLLSAAMQLAPVILNKVDAYAPTFIIQKEGV